MTDDPKSPKSDGSGGAGGSERRTSPRAGIALRVEYAKLNAFFSDYTKNISHGGTFIHTEDPLPVGTVFMFRLVVPKLPDPIQLRGQVMWVKATGLPLPQGVPADHESGMGIRFLYDSPEQRAAITETVEQLMIESLGSLLYHKLMNRRTP